MKITNKYGLPDAIYQAILRQDEGYDPGRSDITATGLIRPPWMARLIQKHWDELSEDASERYWVLMGSAVHAILEESESLAFTEDRLYAEFAGWTVGMQFDRMSRDRDRLQDYKFTSVWDWIYGAKTEHVQQLNIGAELAVRTGYPITKVQIVYLFRDWMSSKAKFDREYPPRPIMVKDVPLWPQEERTAFIEHRVALHQRVRENVDLEPCTDDERWLQPGHFALIKKGAKRAVKIEKTPDLLIDYVKKGRRGTGKVRLVGGDVKPPYLIEERKGAYRRCESFCPVRRQCPIGRPLWEAFEAGS